MAPRPKRPGESDGPFEPDTYGYDYGGASTMAGGWGDDTYIIDNVGDRIVEMRGQGTDTAVLVTGNRYTMEANVDNARAGADVRINVVGNELRNEITGGRHDDYLFGGGGRDTIDGGDGFDQIDGGTDADTMIGGNGNDIYFVDNNSDVIREYMGGGTDTVFVSASSYRLSDYVDHAQALTSAGATLYGNSLVNYLYGNDGVDFLFGGAENDHLFGFESGDVLDGGPGADNIATGSGADIVVLRRGETEGDVLVDFNGFGHHWRIDKIHFSGFGTDGLVVPVDATHYTVSTRDGSHSETFEILTGRPLIETDYMFM